MTDTSPILRGALLALLAFGIYATHDVIIKALGGTYSPVQTVFFSVLFGFPLVTLLLLRDRSEANLIPKHPLWTLVRTVAVVITGVTAFYAFSVLPLAQTYAILFAAPLLITLLAIPMLGERVGIRRGIAVVVGLAGVMVVLRPGAEPLTLGHLAALLSAFTGALGAVIMRKVGREERSVVLILYPMIGNFLFMGAALPFVYRPMPLIDLAGLAVIAALALVATHLVIRAYRAAPAVVVAPMQYSQILWATFYGVVLFDESLDLPTALGAGIIIASGVYIVLREGRVGVSRTTPVLRTRTRLGLPVSPRVSTLMRDREDPAE
ncbi:DMT family transporter [Roseicyclus persicicus]|uniref:DMT family transporter n=1 Tax=Roseicyclus persicicus TaxID=2650661 RepID=A0A7X6GVF8_9RHOB|nr:DMT family transporter [Roseibacterium persicicum]NKX43096.1 DMT family transporter [Roseibacterium persicicum]